MCGVCLSVAALSFLLLLGLSTNRNDNLGIPLLRITVVSATIPEARVAIRFSKCDSLGVPLPKLLLNNFLNQLLLFLLIHSAYK